MSRATVPPDTPPFTEDQVAQIPALHLLIQLGYEYLTPREAAELRGGRLGDVLLLDVLAEQLRRLNTIRYKGEEVPFSEGNILEAVRALREPVDDGLLRTNESTWELLRFGKSLPQLVAGDNKSFALRYIDWDRPERNVFHVSDEFAVKARGLSETRRPDIVLFVNGIPCAVIECKRPGLPAGHDPIDEAIGQQLRNQGEQEIPRLFHYAQIVLALARNDAAYGAVGTPRKLWSRWREPELDERDLEGRIGTSLAERDAARLFVEDSAPFHHRFRNVGAPQARAWFERLLAAGRQVTEQDRALYALCRPERLLELADRYTVFEAGERKIARHQQYRCVERAMRRIRAGQPGEAKTGGVVWHTQGSGKSLTMVMLAEAILAESSRTDSVVSDPRLVLVTDRVDLDDQLYRVFLRSGVELEQATTGKHLLELLESSRARVITTVVHKFRSALASRAVRIPSPDIFVLVDEGHRSHYGPLHGAMEHTLPNACLFAFTGTPLSLPDRNTVEKFGGVIDSYTISEAMTDEAVVPLLYEGRHAHQTVDQLPIDAWFERYTAGLSEDLKAILKRRYSTADALNTAEQKVRAIAWDISVHFNTLWQGTGFKGQLVARDKATALLYHRFLEEFHLVSSEVLISPPDAREGEDAVDEVPEASQRPTVAEFWDRMMKRFGSEKQYQRDLISRFKTAEEPEILIVVDKLLVGFDAPRNTVLYLTRRFSGDHTLLQAIARVNRVAEGKDHGYIVDYAGVLSKLGEAIDLYSALSEEYEAGALDDIIRDAESEWRELPHRHSTLWSIFRGVPNRDDQEAMEVALASAEMRQRFYERLSVYTRTLKLGLGSVGFLESTPSELIARYQGDLKYFVHLRSSVARRYGERVDFKEYQKPVQKLLDTYVGAGEVETVVEPVSIFDREELQREIDAQTTARGKAELIANRTRRAITERMDEDPVYYRRFSEMLKETIREYEQQRLDDATFLRRMEAIRHSVRDRVGDATPDALHGRDVAKAYYGVLDESLDGEVAEGTLFSSELALRVEEIIDSLRITDWTSNLDVQNRMKTAIEDELFRYADERGLDLTYERVDEILDRCLDIARTRRPGGGFQ